MDSMADAVNKLAVPLGKFGMLPSIAAIQNGMIAAMPTIIVGTTAYAERLGVDIKSSGLLGGLGVGGGLQSMMIWTAAAWPPIFLMLTSKVGCHKTEALSSRHPIGIDSGSNFKDHSSASALRSASTHSAYSPTSTRSW